MHRLPQLILNHYCSVYRWLQSRAGDKVELATKQTWRQSKASDKGAAGDKVAAGDKATASRTTLLALLFGLIFQE